jgi:hypothetical protein
LAVLAFVVTIVVAARHALLPRQASAFDLYEPHPR